MNGSFRIKKSLVVSSGGTGSESGEITVNSNKVEVHNGTSSSPVVTEAHTATLTNKTLDAAANTISNLVDANIKAGAAIAYSKLNLAGSIVNADVSSSAAIAYSKLNLAGSILNADIATGAAIAYSKLSLTGSIVNADISSSAAIAISKINTGLSGSLVGTSDTQTLSNKSFSDAVTLPAISTPSTPASSKGKIYFKSDGFLYQLNDAGTETKVGAGSGGINYISNPDAESGTSGYSVVANTTPGSTPTVAQAGTPATGFTFTRDTTAPLRGTANFLITKPAINSQGTMVKYPFTIASADQAKMLQISAEYNIASGTYADGDMTFYIQDVTNGSIIQPAGYQIMKLDSTINGRIQATFQTASNSTSYALLIYVASTSASAYTIKLDSISVSPVVTTTSTFVGDWQSYTPTITNISTSASAGKWRRVGDSMEGEISFTSNGTASGTILVSMPSGYSIDDNKLVNGFTGANNSFQIVGQAAFRQSGNVFEGIVYRSASTNTFSAGNSGNTGGDWGSSNTAAGLTIASGNFFIYRFRVPISGWGTSQLTNDSSAEGRVVAMYAANQTPTGTISSSGNVVKFGTVSKDTHGAYDTSTGLYTVKVPGWYSVTGTLDITCASTAVNGYQATILNKNNVTFASSVATVASTSTLEHVVTATGLVYCLAGDILGVYSQTNKTTPSFSGNLLNSSMSITRISGNEQVLSSETVAARYISTSGQSIPNSGTTILQPNTKIWDTHNSVTTGSSWKFVAPVSGKYSVKAAAQFASAAYASGNYMVLRIYKNGGLYSSGPNIFTQAAVTLDFSIGISDEVQLLAGEYICINIENNRSAGATTLSTNSDAVYVSIVKIGNY